MKQFYLLKACFLASCLFWVSPLQAEPAINLIDSFEHQYSEDNAVDGGWNKREIRANLNAKALDTLATGELVSSLRASLFPDVVLDLQSIKSDERWDGTVVNDFLITGDKGGSAVLSVTDGVLYGSVTTGTNVKYRIQRESVDVYRIEELDESKLPECGNPSGPWEPPALEQPKNNPETERLSDEVTSRDNGTLIDVLVVYTQAAETAAGGAGGMASLIATAEAETNAGYSASGVNFIVNVVHTNKVSYNEASGFTAALNALTFTSDGLMDEVHGLRDNFGADLVVLLINNSESCGLGWQPATVSASNELIGFSVVAHNCATGYYSFAHEMGHNMGALHDTYVDSSSQPYSYGHGYVNYPARVRSIMAYNDLCSDVGANCARVNHWSATDRLYNGSTTIGDQFSTNNVALNNSAWTIANYRSGLALPLPPATVNASDGTYTDKIAVSWSAVTSATAYNIYISSTLTSSKSYLGQITGTSANITGTTPGATRYIWIYSVNAAGESSTGTYDTGYVQAETPALPDPPSQVNASDGTYTDKIVVSWSAVTGATAYNIYISSTLTSSKSYLGQITGTSANITGSTPGATRYIWIYSFNVAGESASGTYDTGYVANEQGCTAPQTQVLNNLTISNTQTFEACVSIETGPNFNIQGTNGNVTLRAGDNVTLKPGTNVEPGGSLIIKIELPQ